VQCRTKKKVASTAVRRHCKFDRRCTLEQDGEETMSTARATEKNLGNVVSVEKKSETGIILQS
jgi:hypothetical protein